MRLIQPQSLVDYSVPAAKISLQILIEDDFQPIIYRGNYDLWLRYIIDRRLTTP